MSMQGSREGFALAAAVMALVLVGALVTGGFYAASQESQIASSNRFAGEAFNVAEHGLHKVVGTWKLADFEKIDIGQFATFVDTLRAGPTSGARAIGEATVEVRRLATFSYFLTSTGRLINHGRANGSKRTLGMLVRTSRLNIKQDRAVQVMGGLNVAGNSTVNGTDYLPTNWGGQGDCVNKGTMAGVVAKDISQVDTTGNGSIVGQPTELEDPSIDSTSFTQFGDWDYDELAAMADDAHTYPDGTTMSGTAPDTLASGECNTASSTNWGDPDNPDAPCGLYFPIIHVKGDLSLKASGGGAKGQGILLVDGNLDLAGGFEFNGVVIVKGHVTTGAGHSQLNGVTMIMNRGEGESNLGISKLAGTPVVNFSSCAIQRAVRYNDGTARAFPITERSWVDLTAAGLVTDET